MNWSPDKDRPICPQIVEQVCAAIAGGKLAPGEKLLSVREIAVKAGVNPNTVQKAIEQLESAGVIYSMRGSGSFVSDDTSIAKEMLSKMISDKTAAFFNQLRAFGLSDTEIKTIVKEWK